MMKRVDIEPFVPYAEAVGNLATTLLEQGASVFGLGATIALLKGIYSVSTGAYKEIYADNLMKLQRVQSRIGVLDTELKSYGLCVNEDSLANDVMHLAEYLTKKRKLKAFISLFNSKTVAEEVQSLVTRLLFSYESILTEVSLVLLYLLNETSGKPNTPLLDAFISDYKGKCVKKFDKKFD